MNKMNLKDNKFDVHLFSSTKTVLKVRSVYLSQEKSMQRRYEWAWNESGIC